MTSSTPKTGSSGIAVVIPVRNGERFISRALASVAAQTVAADEVIVVDDMSTDATAYLAKHWVGLLPLSVITLAAQSGTWQARSIAIEHSDSPLIAQLDADDILLPYHLAEMLAAHERQPGLISARRLIIHQESHTPSARQYELDPEPQHRLSQLLIRNYLCVGTLFSRTLYAQAGGYRPMKFAEDWDLWLRMASLGADIVRPPTPTYIYRIGAGSKTSEAKPMRAQLDFELLKGAAAHLQDLNLIRAAHSSMLQRNPSRYLQEFGHEQHHGGQRDGTAPLPSGARAWSIAAANCTVIQVPKTSAESTFTVVDAETGAQLASATFANHQMVVTNEIEGLVAWKQDLFIHNQPL